MPPNVISATRTREQVAKSNGAMLLGGVVVEMPDRAKSASALYQVSADDPPFLIMHGDADPGVPLDQSGRLHAALQAAGVSSTPKVLPGAAHGGPEFATPESRAVILEFLRTRLGGGQ